MVKKVKKTKKRSSITKDLGSKKYRQRVKPNKKKKKKSDDEVILKQLDDILG